MCSINFSKIEMLREHVRNTHRTETYKCNLCSKVFLNPNTLQYHHQLDHTVIYYKCSFCDNCFDNCPSLDSHVMMQHSQGYEIQQKCACRFCDEMFDSPWDLIKHLELHYLSQQFVCMYSGLVLLGVGESKHHITISHNETP